MVDDLRWRDVIEEVTGRQEELGPSPWDALSLITVARGEGARVLRPEDVDLTARVGEGEDALSLRHPLVLTDNSWGQMSPQARLALVQAAAQSGCALRLPDPSGDYLELAGELEVPLWAVVAPRRLGPLTEVLEASKVVELQLATLEPEGGMTRPVDAWDKDGSLAPAVGTLRAVSGGDRVVVNVGPTADGETLRSALAAGADGVMVQALSRRSPLHPRLAGPSPLAAVASMRRSLERTKPTEDAPRPVLVVSGGFKDGVELAKALALGADLVVCGTSARLALGCTLCAECGPGECPKMVLGQGPGGGAPLADWKAAAIGLVEYMDRVELQARRALAQMGCSSVGEAGPSHLEARTYDTAAVTGTRLAGYGDILPMWLH